MFNKFKIWIIRGCVGQIALLDQRVANLEERMQLLETQRSWDIKLTGESASKEIGAFMVKGTGYKSKKAFDDGKFDNQCQTSIRKLLKKPSKNPKHKSVPPKYAWPQEGIFSLVRPQAEDIK